MPKKLLFAAVAIVTSLLGWRVCVGGCPRTPPSFGDGVIRFCGASGSPKTPPHIGDLGYPGLRPDYKRGGEVYGC